MVIKDHYRKTGQWAVEHEQAPKELVQYIKECRWPSEKLFKTLNIDWYRIKKKTIFDIPADIPISQLYSDKSFSMTRSELSDHLSDSRNLFNPVPSKRVLEELLKRRSLDPRKLAEEINDNGLPEDDLIIGLKEKERELKRIGRFFTLMSWRLREYIVLTEYLIKIHYIPLFEGVTMSDGLTTVVKKMIQVTEGQSSKPDRCTITFSNHIDYEKWNNHQRGESVNPVFKVMGDFFGLPLLFVRTHEFFSKALIYYSGRPDLVQWNILGPRLNVVEDDRCMAWNGQPGGLEGVRQKGWTIVGVLCILKEGLARNTRVRILAQGDNQVIFTDYRLLPSLSFEEQIDTISSNNSIIMRNIVKSTRRLGLLINEDETFTSGGFTVYGKVPLIFGNTINLETKKWNRIACVTNDQIPTICNVMGVIGSTALGSAQGSRSFMKQLDMYMYYSLLMFHIHDAMNVLHASPITLECTRTEFVGKLLFFDKSIGGYTGIRPTRFLVRQYPDPISESLAFWGPQLHSLDESVRRIARQVWNPIIKPKKSTWIRELAENPAGLNIDGGSNIENIFKQEVKAGLIRQTEKIKNDVIRSSLELTRDYETEILNFLSGVNPCFPRFVSGFMEASVIGLSDGVIGLIQNSRTMRNLFKRNFSKKVFNIIVNFELKAKKFLGSKRRENHILTLCSATRADELRNESWGVKIVGQTVPHPYEYLVRGSPQFVAGHVGVGCPVPVPSRANLLYNTGPIIPYIGSRTSEDTSVLKTWERELVNPLGRKAFNLLRCIDWFVPNGSNLCDSIMNNLFTITELSHIFDQKTSMRSGCPIHRFSVSRQSSGGFSSVNPNNLRWMYVTAESWPYGNDVNMDFMHQSAMLVAQLYVSEKIDLDNQTHIYNKFFLSCQSCMREIKPVSLDSKDCVESCIKPCN